MRGLTEICRKTQVALQLSKRLGDRSGKNPVAIFSDMLYYWLAAQMNPASYGLYGFEKLSRREKAEYLSKRQMDRLQERLNPPEFTALADDKLLFYERCRQHDIPTPAILGVVLNQDSYVPAGVERLGGADELAGVLAASPPEGVVLKALDGGHGLGLLLLEHDNGVLRDKGGHVWTAPELIEHCRHGCDSYGRPSRGFLVQQRLIPHDELKAVMPGPAMGTVRLHTLLRRDGSVASLYPIVKVPIKGNLADNFDHGRTGNLLAWLDVETGYMQHACAKEEDGWGLVVRDRHPDTGVAFKSVRIPGWEELLAVVERAARAFGELKTLAWDIAVTDQGAYILEANWHYDPDGPQVSLRRGVRSEILRYFAQAA